MNGTKSSPDISVGILAGGKSTRMGENKALLKIGNERMIDRLHRELKPLGEVYISCAHKGDYEDVGALTVTDEYRDCGPIEGIRRVLEIADTDYVFICGADMPFITKDLVRYLLSYISSDYDCIVIADEDHIHPLCAVYHKRVLPFIEEMMSNSDYRIRDLFKKVRTRYVDIADSRFDKKCVKNINTKEDYVQVLKPFIFCVSGYSDSGKTFLIEKLINEFKSDGLSVGVCKHDGHGRFSDVPGSDTDRILKAGAREVSIFSDTGFRIERVGQTDRQDIIRRMMDMEDPPDVLIFEGLKDSDIPKVVMSEVLMDDAREPVICFVTCSEPPTDYDRPVFDRDDVCGIFLCIKKYLRIP